jgi:LPS biosynthesis protein
MTELRHLQLVILEIAKDIDKLCRENSIEYFILGGSAIGAIRHKGFIPWDDDFDIIMDSKNYARFCKVCREQLDIEKYYFQEGEVDWPCLFSKVKLKGTVFEEPSAYLDESGEKGIFIDIFGMENAPSGKMAQRWQYICAKYLLCYSLLQRGWGKVSLAKRLMTIAAYPLKIKGLRKFFKRQVEKWNEKDTEYYAYFTGPYRMNQCFFERKDFADSIDVPFEDAMFPVPVGYDNWLRHIFGDYMTPPPVQDQVGRHLMGVDFGKY